MLCALLVDLAGLPCSDCGHLGLEHYRMLEKGIGCTLCGCAQLVLRMWDILPHQRSIAEMPSLPLARAGHLH
jgi:hypothetical protein